MMRRLVLRAGAAGAGRAITTLGGAGAPTLVGAGGVLLPLAGCAGSSPPTRWYALRNDPPAGAATGSAAAGAGPATSAGPADVWEVSRSVRIPGALDRDTLFVEAGTAGLQPLSGHRWAEPLQDSVPRLLLHDLALLRGPGRTWAAPAPAGVAVVRRLGVELLTLQGSADRRTLRLQAQWSLQEVQAGAGAPVQGRADFSVELADTSVDALAAGHRLALWRLAERVAAQGAPAG